MPPDNWATGTSYFYKCCHGSGMHCTQEQPTSKAESDIPQKIIHSLEKVRISLFYMRQIMKLFFSLLKNYNVLKRLKSLIKLPVAC